METIFKKALDKVKANENLKQKTTAYILNAGSNVVSINSATYKKPPIYAKRLVAAACMAAVLCALPIGGYAYYQTPTSYVSVDINPSVELGINAFGKVVSVQAYNTDGETVIAGLSLMHANVESAVMLLVKSASQNGYIKDDGSTFISVTAETNNNKKAEKLQREAQLGAENAIESEDDAATVASENIALDRRDEAISLGITPGKLNLIQKLQELDPAIITDDYKDTSVTDIQKKFVELKKNHHDKNDHIDDRNETATQSPDAGKQDNNDDDKNPNNHSNGNNKGNGFNNNDDEDYYGDSKPEPGTTTTPRNNGTFNHP